MIIIIIIIKHPKFQCQESKSLKSKRPESKRPDHASRVQLFRYVWWNIFTLKGPLSSLRVFLAIESLLKMIQYIFISYQKLFSFLRYLHFYPDFLVMHKNGLIRKLWLISKCMTSQTGQQIIIIHILINITRS